MAEHHPAEGGASTSGASVSNSDSTVELNIKTLDSQIYSFHVEKNMPVSSFKGKIADQIGIPVGQQRLIFRGKVLKDDHLLSEYHVENGDTLHLVERQPTQPQTSSGIGHADTSGNVAQGNDGSTGALRNRIGQISHSVVLGTFNVGDQGEGAVPDLNRVIGAVLNSLGVGNQAGPNAAAAAAAAQHAAPPNSGTQGSDTERGRGSTAAQSQAGNQTQFGQPFSSQPFHIPFTGTSIPLPSPNMPIPDSLNTLSEFITRMEEVLSQNGYQHTPSPSGMTDQSTTAELPSNAWGLPTPEALSIVLRHAQRLLSGQAVAALSHIAGRLEQEAASTVESVRSQIQTESIQVGLAMQHLGALLLELGRTILLLRMGRSPAEAVVNAGPAVYISPSGPNPIMVQPFPHQTSPLFNTAAASPPNTGSLGPVGIIGSAPRHINIHIHAGTSLAPMVSAVGARAANGEVAQGERSGGAASGDYGATRAFPFRNVLAAAVPSRAATIAVSPATIAVSPALNTSQPVGGVSTSQPRDAGSIADAVSEVNSQIRNFLQNMQAENQTSSGQQDNPSVPNSFSGSGRGSATEPSRSLYPESSEEATGASSGYVPELHAQEGQTESQKNAANGGVSKPNDDSISLVEPSPSRPTELAENSERNLKEAQKPGDFDDKSSAARDVPLGLGGGLQPKRRSRQSNMQLQSGEGGTVSSHDQSQQARTSGLQVLQSLASRSAAGRTGSIDAVSRQTEPGFGQAVAGTQLGTQGADGQFDVTGMMSQVLHSPALNGLLSGVAQQTGVGSPDALRNMLQQFTQNPAMRNTVNQLAQQVDGEDVRSMFAGMGTGQDGGLDFSSMIQQMMPLVSQVLGGNTGQNEQARSMVPELRQQFDDTRLSGVDNSFNNSQDDLHEVVQRIQLHNAPQEIFRAAVQIAAERSGIAAGELVDGLSGNEDLADQFVENLCRDLHRQLQGDAASGGNS